MGATSATLTTSLSLCLAHSLLCSLTESLALCQVRTWVYTVFYIVSELWGDVILSLLFWGLANERTSVQDAHIMYPLLGAPPSPAPPDCTKPVLSHCPTTM